VTAIEETLGIDLLSSSSLSLSYLCNRFLPTNFSFSFSAYLSVIFPVGSKYLCLGGCGFLAAPPNFGPLFTGRATSSSVSDFSLTFSSFRDFLKEHKIKFC
jgi:hypothetical protein